MQVSDGDDCFGYVRKDNIMLYADVVALQIALVGTFYTTPNVLMPFGGDFQFQDAGPEFGNFSAIMDFINASPSYGQKLKYGHMSDYLPPLPRPT
jgi:hypothetical protein